MKEQVKNISKYVLFTLLGALFGSVITYLLLNNNTIISNTCNLNDKKLAPVYEAYNVIKNEYYKDIDDNTIINGMINGIMLSTDDKHTMFFNEEETKEFQTEIDGTYYGIGAVIYQLEDGDIAISRVFDNSPAKKFGLEVGDVIISIDGDAVHGKTSTEVSNILRSENKGTATLLIKRENNELTIEIEKSMVEIAYVSSQKLDNNIGYIAISLFSATSDQQFYNSLNKLYNEGIDSLIIDLRGNGGGYLSTVTNIISMFVDEDTVIYQIKDRKKTQKYYATNDYTLNYKVVILVDEESASASEIMASALKEQYNAILVGKTTYGKGTVQQTKLLSNNTLIKYTTEEWLTSKGESIHEKGIKPDYEIELGEEYKSNPIMENDMQLQKAIELLK